jgi:putative flippase GtrA
MVELLRHPELRRFARFLVVGVINTLFGYGVFAALVLARLDSAAALALATVAGVIFNYFTTGKLVFANQGGAMLPRFILAYCLSYGANLAMLKGLERLGVDTLVAQALCLPPTVILSFALLRWFVFRDKGEA